MGLKPGQRQQAGREVTPLGDPGGRRQKAEHGTEAGSGEGMPQSVGAEPCVVIRRWSGGSDGVGADAGGECAMGGQGSSRCGADCAREW